MRYEFLIGLLDCDGVDHYQTVVVEASSLEEATNLAQEAMMANLGGLYVAGEVTPRRVVG